MDAPRESTKSGIGRAVSYAVIALCLLALPVVLITYARRAKEHFRQTQLLEKAKDCTAKLANLHVYQRAYYGSRSAYSDKLGEVTGYVESSHYALVLGEGEDFIRFGGPVDMVSVGAFPSDNSLDLERILRGVEVAKERGVGPGVRGLCPKCEFTAICVGQLDDDETLDVWSIASDERHFPDGGVVAAGTVSHDVNDVTE